MTFCGVLAVRRSSRGVGWSFRGDGWFCEVEDDGRELFLVSGAPAVG